MISGMELAPCQEASGMEWVPCSGMGGGAMEWNLGRARGPAEWIWCHAKVAMGWTSFSNLVGLERLAKRHHAFKSAWPRTSCQEECVLKGATDACRSHRFLPLPTEFEVTEKFGDFWVSLLLNIRNLRSFEAGPSFAAIAMCIRKLII